jgi:hypothetical protein
LHRFNSSKNPNEFPDDLLDPELHGIVVEQIQILFFLLYIPLQPFVDLLNVNLIPAAQYIADHTLEIKYLDLIPVGGRVHPRPRCLSF